MATVNKEIADQIIERDGWYGGGDPRVMRVVEYRTFNGDTAYAIEYAHELGRYRPSQYVINPKTIWEAR